MEVNYHEKEAKAFCVLTRPETYRLIDFLSEFETLLCYKKNLRNQSYLIGDFNIDRLVRTPFNRLQFRDTKCRADKCITNVSGPQ